jgi:lipopolysaccharide transport system ATP-binding protein
MRRLWNSTYTTQNSETLWALKEVSFEIKHGEVLGIIGRNGAGKTTLLKILSHITEPTEGRAIIHGMVGSLLEVGTGFHPELTGRENIYLNGAILGMKRDAIKRRFDEIVAFAEVDQFIDTPVKRYSSGMYLRLAFAVAAHMEQEILLVDEVLAVGDAAFQKKCLWKIGEVSKIGRTVLFVSHNMTAIKSLCKRAIWLDKGWMIKFDEVNSTISEYLHRGVHFSYEQKWDHPSTAPGNERVKIRRAAIQPLNPGLDPGIYVDTPIQLIFEFWNFLPGAILNFTIHLFTIEGEYVMAIGSDAKPRHAGLVRGTVEIPANMLNDKTYTVSLQIVKDTSITLYQHPEILVFEVNDTARVGSWFGKWPGVVRPNLRWLTEDIREE